MEYDLEQYQTMAKSFNTMEFKDKIKKLQEYPEIIVLASDGNWWGVKATNEEIQEELYETETGFQIEQEWDSREMHELIALLGLKTTDI